MAEERNFLEKFIFPTEKEQKAFKKKQDKAKVITESLEEEGLFKTLQRQKEEEALDQGVPESEVRKNGIGL